MYDIARTVYLIEYTPIPLGIRDDEKERVLLLKTSLADQYIRQMNVSREMLQDYLSVIRFARKGE